MIFIIIYLALVILVSIYAFVKGQNLFETFVLSILVTPFVAFFFVYMVDRI